MTSIAKCNRELSSFQSVLHTCAPIERARTSWLDLGIIYVACAQLGSVLGALSAVGGAL